MARLLADENFPSRAAAELQRRGHDVVTLLQLGRTDQALSDADVLALARRERRAVMTHDRWDFIRLHDADPKHSGIVVCTADSDVLALAARIDVAVASAPSLDGQLIRVNRPGQ